MRGKEKIDEKKKKKIQQHLLTACSAEGPIDVLVCNVGIFAVKDFVEITDE